MEMNEMLASFILSHGIPIAIYYHILYHSATRYTYSYLLPYFTSYHSTSTTRYTYSYLLPYFTSFIHLSERGNIPFAL